MNKKTYAFIILAICGFSSIFPGQWHGNATAFHGAQTNIEPDLSGLEKVLLGLALGVCGMGIATCSALCVGWFYLLGTAVYEDYKDSIKYNQYTKKYEQYTNMLAKIDAS